MKAVIFLVAFFMANYCVPAYVAYDLHWYADMGEWGEQGPSCASGLRDVDKAP